MPPLDSRTDFADDGASFRVRRERQVAAQPRVTLAQAIVAPWLLYWALVIGAGALLFLALLAVWVWHAITG